MVSQFCSKCVDNTSILLSIVDKGRICWLPWNYHHDIFSELFSLISTCSTNMLVSELTSLSSICQTKAKSYKNDMINLLEQYQLL